MANKVSLEVVNFKQELKRIEQEVLDLAEAGLHERVEYATKQLRVVTPVDTGEAREGWEYETTSLKKILGLEDIAVIRNEVDHVTYLNQGSSKQAPKYFIEQVLSTIGLITSQ